MLGNTGATVQVLILLYSVTEQEHSYPTEIQLIYYICHYIVRWKTQCNNEHNNLASFLFMFVILCLVINAVRSRCQTAYNVEGLGLFLFY